MPVERKPLFRPEVVAAQATTLGLVQGSRTGEEAARTFVRWAELLASPRAESLTERELLPDFLTEIFYAVLGYRGPSGAAEAYTFSREKHVEVDGKVADAVLGRFGPAGHHVLAAVEGKGPRDPLDRPFAGRRMSAVDQAYRYAINLRCDWIVVTNLHEIRLYHKGHDQRTYERFAIAELATDPAAAARFVFVLGAERVAPEAGEGHLGQLLRLSERAGEELTRSYYADYAELRREILAHLQTANPTVIPELLLFYAQKLLDRVLFVAFAEDRGLLPAESLRRAFAHEDPYNPRSRWETFQGLFRAIDAGNARLDIPAYNGGLFAADPGLDRLEVPGEVFGALARLGDYDYRPAGSAGAAGARPLVDVEILGHIFEQSITDLEEIEQELAAGLFAPRNVSRRRLQGAFYTPRAVTRYLVGEALSPLLEERFAALGERHLAAAPAAARPALGQPRAYDLAALGEKAREALVLFWEGWLAELETVRILDPACGSGAFLIEAFDQLYGAYQEATERLADLRGQRSLFDPDATILGKNLFGVDINEEAVQICRLSIWIKTAQRGRQLTALDRTIRPGNSLVADPAVDRRSAFDWQAAFPEVFAAGGFDLVVGNPPYVRQERLADLKPHLERTFRAFHGMADLYVYFFEQGLRLLRPGGRLSFVVTNKWLKAGYAEPLRRLLAEETWTEEIVDLGHAKRIFPDADVFPSLVRLRRPLPAAPPPEARIAVIPREAVQLDDLGEQVRAAAFAVPRARLGAAPWSLEPPAVEALMAKLRERGKPLTEYLGSKPFRGVLTGLNEAFLVDTPTRDRLVAEDPRSAELLRPYLRGQDVRRWRAEWGGLWMIFTRRGTHIESFPALLRHLSGFRNRLEPRPLDFAGTEWPGRKSGNYAWYEIQDTVGYHSLLDQPKILYQDIAWQPGFAMDRRGVYCNNAVYFLPSGDGWLLAVLNSPVVWWYAWRGAQHGKDEALRLFSPFMESVVVPAPEARAREAAEQLVDKLTGLHEREYQARLALLDWLQVEHGVDSPSRRLGEPFALSSDELVAEVRRARGKRRPLSAAALRSLREEHARTVVPVAARLREAEVAERELAALVCDAYGLTPEEVELIRQTAPPRMPPLGEPEWPAPADSGAPEPLA
jgi:SAM-dependent methyltransferase